MKNSSLYVVDLFCGAGGLTHGFMLENIDVIAGIDIDPACQYPYEANNDARFIQADIASLSPSTIDKLFPDNGLKILVGCAPCQPFSSYAARVQRHEPWRLLEKFADIIVEVKPDIISMENVPRLVDYEGGKVFKNFVNKLSDYYSITDYQVFCPDYGIPQRRKRLVVFGSRFGSVQLIEPTHAAKNYRSVQDAIGKLPPLEHGQTNPDDPLHTASALSSLNYQRIKSSKPDGTWRDWDRELIADCHTKKTGRTYSGVYGRMSWSKPAPTITTQFYGFGNGRFGHPEQNRALSLREGAILQTFPENYRFLRSNEEVYKTTLGKLIGNAVPVDLGRVIAKSISRHLEKHCATT